MAPSMTSSDLALILGLSVCYPAARWLLDKTLFTWLSRTWLVPISLRKGKAKLPDKLTNKIVKMNEALWKLVCYSTFVGMVSWALLSQSWVHERDTRKFWEGWPSQPDTALLQGMCLMEIGYYVSGAGMVLWWEVSRKDQNVMLLHHLLAILIIGCCWYCNYSRACCVAMLLHDINDVIMELAKISNYNQLDGLANALFVAFVLAWVALRMVAYPLVIVRSTLFEIVQVLGPNPPYYWVINVPMLALYVIHCYWLYLIIRAVVHLVVTGKAEDVREDED